MGKRRTEEFKHRTVGDISYIELKTRAGDIYETIVDSEDLERIIYSGFSWHLKWAENSQQYYVKATYIYRDENGKRHSTSIYLHSYILGIAHTKTPIDHINHVGLDNRKVNLRPSTTRNNLMNRKGKNKNNKSGYRNVSLINNKYFVQLQVNGKGTWFGEFSNPEEANEFAIRKRKEIYGDYAGLS